MDLDSICLAAAPSSLPAVRPLLVLLQNGPRPWAFRHLPPFSSPGLPSASPSKCAPRGSRCQMRPWTASHGASRLLFQPHPNGHPRRPRKPSDIQMDDGRFRATGRHLRGSQPMVFDAGQPLRLRYTRYTQGRWPVLETSLVTPSGPLFWADEQWFFLFFPPARARRGRASGSRCNGTGQDRQALLLYHPPKPQTSRCMTVDLRPRRALGPIGRPHPAFPCCLATGLPGTHTRLPL